MAETPELRASDADREHAAELLRAAAGAGRLTVEELDERLDAAFAARTRGELETLVADIVVPGSAAPLPVRPGDGGTRWLVSIMGGHDRRGHWRVGPHVVNVNVWGGSDIDLNDAELSAPETTIRVISIMGGADVWVPDGLDVRVSELALMGSNDVRLGREPPAPGGPVVHVKVFSLMGGSTVRRGRRLTREERRARKLQQREQRRIDRGQR